MIRGKVGREHLLVHGGHIALAVGAVDADVQHLDGCDLEIRGLFLDGFEIPDARPFEDWKDEWRARLLPRVRDCLVRQMDAGRRTGDFATVERRADVLRELDPLSEDAVSGLIEARAWVGDRSTALKVFAAYEARLAQELGAKPSPDLVRMASLLREGRRTAPPRGVAEPSRRAEKRFEAETLIGREREFSVLYDAWLGARRRTPGIVVLTGDPGLGKTTLANAFVSACQLEGAVVARAQAYDAERELPFAVLAELVRQLAIQRAIGCADPEALSELSRLTSEVTAQFPGVPKPAEWAAEIVPLRLADAFLKTVTAAAEESPVVLVVDDIHAADNASTAILHIVARKLPATRLLLILAARSTELRASGAPGALTSDATLETLRSLDLEPLPDEAATRLVERLRVAGGGDGELPLERILRAGRGNPLALELLTREWVAHGPESLLRDLEAVNTQPAAAIGIPRAIKVVFERQVARLDAKTRAVLDLAAVLGRRLADLSLYQAVDCTPAEAAEALGRLRDEGFVREVHGDIEFRNELIRAQAYYAVPGAGRQHLHSRVGELLSAGRGRATKLEIAWHFLRSGQPTPAVGLAIEGSEEALQVGAPREVESMMTVLLQQYSDQATLDRLQVLLARALLDQSKGDAALAILAQIPAGSSHRSVEEAGEVALMRATAEYLVGRETGVLHYRAAEEALVAAERASNPDLLARSLFEYARSGLEIGDPHRVLAAKDRLERLRVEAGTTLPIGLYAEAYCHYYLDNVADAADRLRSAVAMLHSERNVRYLSMAYNGYGVCAQALCRLDDARDAYSRGLELTRKLGDDSRASVILCNLSVLERFAGNLKTALPLAEESLRLGIRSLTQPGLLSCFNSLVESYVLCGQTLEALKTLEEGRAWVKQSRNWRIQVDFLSLSVSLALITGQVSAALDLIATAEKITQGRSLALSDAGGFETYRVFRAAHLQGDRAGFRIASQAKARFQGRHLLYYLDAVAAIAWLEMRSQGRYSNQTLSELRLFDDWGVPGKRYLCQAQGFVQGA
ncbi:MAG: ATP-binding protein [Gemmatimonadales bacterium]